MPAQCCGLLPGVGMKEASAQIRRTPVGGDVDDRLRPPVKRDACSRLGRGAPLHRQCRSGDPFTAEVVARERRLRASVRGENRALPGH
jgi:hypothetical protein